jgi:hypothetical protein
LVVDRSTSVEAAAGAAQSSPRSGISDRPAVNAAAQASREEIKAKMTDEDAEAVGLRAVRPVISKQRRQRQIKPFVVDDSNEGIVAVMNSGLHQSGHPVGSALPASEVLKDVPLTTQLRSTAAPSVNVANTQSPRANPSTQSLTPTTAASATRRPSIFGSKASASSGPVSPTAASGTVSRGGPQPSDAAESQQGTPSSTSVLDKIRRFSKGSSEVPVSQVAASSNPLSSSQAGANNEPKKTGLSFLKAPRIPASGNVQSVPLAQKFDAAAVGSPNSASVQLNKNSEYFKKLKEVI